MVEKLQQSDEINIIDDKEKLSQTMGYVLKLENVSNQLNNQVSNITNDYNLCKRRLNNIRDQLRLREKELGDLKDTLNSQNILLNELKEYVDNVKKVHFNLICTNDELEYYKKENIRLQLECNSLKEDISKLKDENKSLKGNNKNFFLKLFK